MGNISGPWHRALWLGITHRKDSTKKSVWNYIKCLFYGVSLCDFHIVLANVSLLTVTEAFFFPGGGQKAKIWACRQSWFPHFWIYHLLWYHVKFYLSCFQNFLSLASCLVYEHLKSLFLALLLPLEMWVFSCEVLSVWCRSLGAQKVITQYLFVQKTAHTSQHLTLHLRPEWTQHPVCDKAIYQM